MYPWRFYFDQLIHFVLAKSRHGTHSPFVYRLVDEVIYPKRRMDEPRDKIERLTARLIDRCKPFQVLKLDSGHPAEPADFVVAEGYDAERIANELAILWPKFHNGSVLILHDIYRNADMKRLWRILKIKPEVTVTIDLFWAGLVFFHPGQAKEHFRIRY